MIRTFAIAFWLSLVPVIAATIPGFRITGPIVPTSTNDTHATHEARYGKGGLRSVADITARDAIPTPRRESGMQVWVESERSFWRLNSDLITWSRIGGSIDISAFGVFPSEYDCSAQINSALAFCASNQVSALISTPGRYAVTSSIVVPSNCRFEMHPEAVLIRKIPSSTADALPQEATVKNSGMTDWQTLGELSLVNSNITLTGIRCRTESTNFYGFHVFMQGVSDLTIDRPFIERSYRAWAITIAASNWVVNLPKIRNGGEDMSYVYQDGIHVTGGQYGRIIGPDIVSGDDSIGFGQHSIPIRDVVVIGGNLRSTHAHNIRAFIGYDYSTNLIERIGIYNVTGSSGSRNATIQTGTASTNVSRPFRNWTIDGVLANTKQSGTNPVAFDAGFIIRNFDGLRLKNSSVPFSIEPNLLLLDCDNVVVENCTFGGTGWTTYNQTLRIERADNLHLLNNVISNSNTNSAYGLYLVSSGRVKVIGNRFDTWASCVTLAGSNYWPVFKHNWFTATGGSQRALLVSDMPTNLVFALNEISAPSSPSFPGYATGTAPDNYVIEMNLGYENPNTDRHVRADNFGPHVRFVQTGSLGTNSIYSTSGRLRLKNENTGLFFASWDPSSSVFYTLGDSSAQASPRPGVIQGEGATGTNVATGPLTLRPGAPTGTSTPPNITMQLYVQGTNENAVTQTAFTGLQLSSTIGTNLVGEAGKSALAVGYWTGSFWSTAKFWRTNIGGINYWIDP